MAEEGIFLFVLGMFCANIEMSSRRKRVSADTSVHLLRCYCCCRVTALLWKFFSRPLLFSLLPMLQPLSLPSLSLIGVSLYLRGNILSVSPAAARSEGYVSVLPCLSHSVSRKHLLSFQPPWIFFSFISVNVCRGRGRRRLPGCGCVRWEASSPTAEPDAGGADQPPGAADSLCKKISS